MKSPLALETLSYLSAAVKLKHAIPLDVELFIICSYVEFIDQLQLQMQFTETLSYLSMAVKDAIHPDDLFISYNFNLAWLCNLRSDFRPDPSQSVTRLLFPVVTLMLVQ